MQSAIRLLAALSVFDKQKPPCPVNIQLHRHREIQSIRQRYEKQRQSRLLSELFVELIFVCEPGGGYNCSHVVRVVSPLVSVTARLGFGRRSHALRVSCTRRGKEIERQKGREGRRVGGGGGERQREKKRPTTRDFLPCVEREERRGKSRCKAQCCCCIGIRLLSVRQ